jgi:hypothetical protein
MREDHLGVSSSESRERGETAHRDMTIDSLGRTNDCYAPHYHTTVPQSGPSQQCPAMRGSLLSPELDAVTHLTQLLPTVLCLHYTYEHSYTQPFSSPLPGLARAAALPFSRLPPCRPIKTSITWVLSPLLKMRTAAIWPHGTGGQAPNSRTGCEIQMPQVG